MKRLRKTNSLRWVMASIVVLIFVLSACSTGGNTADSPAADQPVNNTGNAQSNTPAEDPGDSGEDAAQTENASADQPGGVDAAEGSVSFADEVMPIFESRCIQCHGGDRTEGELTLLTYAQLMEGGKDGQVIVPGDADNSLLAQLIIEQEMPKRGPKLTPAQTQTIIDWIVEGALDN